MTLVVVLCAAFLAHAIWAPSRDSLRSLDSHLGLYAYRWQFAALSLTLAILVRLIRAGTLGAAAVGALFAACFAAASITLRKTFFLHSALPGLLVLFVLTTAATRFRRDLKLRLGLSELRAGRTAAQVVANLGSAAVFASIAANAAGISLRTTMLAAAVAALAEATGDTVSSELGPVMRGRVVIITTGREVPPGVDGGISVKGTAAALAAALILVLVSAAALRFNAYTASITLIAAGAGLFIDSLLGATLETRGFLGNDEVNFLSTLSAALIAAISVALA